MPNLCRCCSHPQRLSIETVFLAGGRSLKDVAAEFSVPYESAKKHFRNHVTAPVVSPVAPAPAQGRATRTVAAVATPPRLHAQATSAVETFRSAFGVEPMPHQIVYLNELRNLVFLKGRQVGATHSAAALAIHCARSKDGALAAVISPSLRQSTEVATRARIGLWQIGERLRQDSSTLLRLENGSRILSLPGNSRGIRGYPADLLIIDEAAWLADETFVAARAMTAATGGRIVVQSTPGAPLGFFHALAMSTPEAWARMVVRSEEASTIDPEFLAREKSEMTPVLYAQEYEASFAAVEDAASIGRWFPPEEYASRVNDNFDTLTPPPGLGLES